MFSTQPSYGFASSDKPDPKTHVEFYMEPILNEFQTKEQGRPIFDEKAHILYLFPADNKKTFKRAVSEEDKRRFPRQWEAFLKNEEQPVSGTAITEWPPLTRKEALELRGIGIHTVEQLAVVPDLVLGEWLGGRELRKKAQLWLDKANDGSQISALVEREAKMARDIEELKRKNDELMKILMEERNTSRETVEIPQKSKKNESKE